MGSLARRSTITRVKDHHGGKDQNADDLGREPFVLDAAQRQADQQRNHDQGEQRHARIVKAMNPSHGPDVGEESNEERDHGQAQRKVDVEDPVPRQAVGDESPQGGADHRREAEHAGNDPLILAALGGREQIADGGHGHGHDGSTPDALNRAEGDQLVHGLAHAGQHRPNQEDADAAEEERLSPVEIG